jgi:hypothetical protein
MLAQQFDFIKTPTEILQALMHSKENRTAIGISSQLLGTDVCITGIEEIILEDCNTTVVLKSYDSNGCMLQTTHLALSDISSVYPFVSELRNPFLDNMEKTKSWFF